MTTEENTDPAPGSAESLRDAQADYRNDLGQRFARTTTNEDEDNAGANEDGTE